MSIRLLAKARCRGRCVFSLWLNARHEAITPAKHISIDGRRPPSMQDLGPHVRHGKFALHSRQTSLLDYTRIRSTTTGGGAPNIVFIRKFSASFLAALRVGDAPGYRVRCAAIERFKRNLEQLGRDANPALLPLCSPSQLR